MPDAKFCKKCQTLKNFADFGRDKGRADGLTYRCLACRKEANTANADVIRKQKKEHYSRHRGVLLERKKLSYAQNSEQKRKYGRERYAQNKERILEKNKQYFASHPDYYKQFRRNNPEKVNSKESKRKAAKLQRIPCWLTADDFWMIEQAYEICALRTKVTGIEWHVDHIIPLQGKKVSGLHTPYNLQVIPASINTSKGNKFEV